VIALLQRVLRAEVSVDGEVVGAIGEGLLVFLAVERADDEDVAGRMLERVLGLRVFADADGRMNRSLSETKGGLLLVPQFTLAADTRKGTRPSFTPCADPDVARLLFDHTLALAAARHQPVASGRFGADMQVSLINDGPVTFNLRVQAGSAYTCFP
jgi:D-aminoacyl-tRNA deacylase